MSTIIIDCFGLIYSSHNFSYIKKEANTVNLDSKLEQEMFKRLVLTIGNKKCFMKK